MPFPPLYSVPKKKREGPKVGRNDKCLCDSGKKFKSVCACTHGRGFLFSKASNQLRSFHCGISFVNTESVPIITIFFFFALSPYERGGDYSLRSAAALREQAAGWITRSLYEFCVVGQLVGGCFLF
jgi:hypothetical protein